MKKVDELIGYFDCFIFSLQQCCKCFLLIFFTVSCSDDKTIRIWQSYEPGNQEGNEILPSISH